MDKLKNKQTVKELWVENARLKEENLRLRKLLGIESEFPKCNEEIVYPARTSSVQSAYTREQKIQIFRNLFRGREDVYAVRWIGKGGKSGYSPACANEWNKELCVKPKLKCSECNNKNYLPLTDKVIYNHLTGKQTIGIYPLLKDETCYFLAVDFDKTLWETDAETFISICREMNIPASVERSRSGNGAHVWIFFDEKIPASLARKVGTVLITKALDTRYQIGFESYDRFFPNQDTLPKGGLGNLIALPLQHAPREKGNSVFIDSNFKPYTDQWEYLANIKKMSSEQVKEIIRRESKNGDPIPIKTVSDSELQDDPWTLPPSGRVKEEKLDIQF